MLAKKYKLSATDFANHATLLFKPINAIKTALFVLKIYPTNLTHSRFGVVVSKKVDKRATVRNSIKRMLYDAFKGMMNVLPNFDYLCIANSKISGITKGIIIEELKKALKIS